MSTLVAIPVYNEQQYVQRVLERVQRYADDILVIDDGSTDDTPLLVSRQPVEVIRHAANRGYGRSIRDAFRWSGCYGYDWLITMDCDEQHQPASLPDFYRAIECDDADVISGSRYLDFERCGNPPPIDRRAINGTITKMINECLGLNLTDAFCGFKAYRVSALKGLTLDVAGYAFPLQFWVQAAAHGRRITEVPIRLIYMDESRSFGGPLDDPVNRMAHYRQVLARELAEFPDKFGKTCRVNDMSSQRSARETGMSRRSPRERAPTS